MTSLGSDKAQVCLAALQPSHRSREQYPSTGVGTLSGEGNIPLPAPSHTPPPSLGGQPQALISVRTLAVRRRDRFPFWVSLLFL